MAVPAAKPNLGPPAKFAAFAGPRPPDDPQRTAIRQAIRTPEPLCVPLLIEAARLDTAAADRVARLARDLVLKLRADGPDRGLAGFMHEYSLSSEEGVALMCLAEALLRIPDDATRDALIRDKVVRGDWRAHLGPERTLFVNAATWGLMVTGRIVAPVPEEGLRSALGRALSRSGEPVIRAAVEMAMHLMGETFVSGQTIAEALAHAQKMERRGFRYSYDMLGEAATTAADATRYLESYEEAIHAIGRASAGRGPIDGPGISIKLSALHPRYARSQRDRVTGELLPRLKTLARLAQRYNIGLNIDAEESDRLDLSLDLLEALCIDPDFAGWHGIGFVIQAYGKRCVLVVDWLAALARRTGHRLMVRLVKGAYWDAEIKQAQLRGLDDYPVFTRKVHTDVSYLAAARRLLDARDAIFPQFATHNAQTLAAVYEMAGADFSSGSYEFQCLHGMGEGLYGHVVGPANLARPCRIYAPVGTHDTLLAYLVRRLLENGANSSFVNRLGDEAIPVDDLTADPVNVASTVLPRGNPHPKIPLPARILGRRRNSSGLDLSDELELERLGEELEASAVGLWTAKPELADGTSQGRPLQVLNPANHADLVGTAVLAGPDFVDRAFDGAMSDWAPVGDRTSVLRRAADRLQAEMARFMGLMMREAGKTAANAIAEVRETVDFFRYYADRADELPAGATPLGTVVCISPWNFPLSIFGGQVAAALAAGNAVIAKPAEETPLTAAALVNLLYEAGVPRPALQFLPGSGEVGAALCGHHGVAGVLFTGSTEVARLIQKQLAPRGAVPFVAETGGINAMIVDSSALAEQVVADVLSSAFDSAGQRCSALRLLCLQADIADRTLDMIRGAMQELRVGDPALLATDVGPVITAEAAGRIDGHVASMRAAGHRVTQAASGPANGTFVPPTLIELDGIDQLAEEIFGPVLHVVRFARRDLDAVVDRINGLGYGLTFGLHTRLEDTIARLSTRVRAGNIYVNRDMIGAVVGLQPFGGSGLSGTGPKAGGPLYVSRLVTVPSPPPATPLLLAGPVGEENRYRLSPRGRVLLLPQTLEGLARMVEITVSFGNTVLVDPSVVGAAALVRAAPAAELVNDWTNGANVDSVIVEGDDGRLGEVAAVAASWPGKVVPVSSLAAAHPAILVREVSLSINTAAAGGNASLVALTEA